MWDKKRKTSMWAFTPEERVNHQGWEKSEEGPVNQNE